MQHQKKSVNKIKLRKRGFFYLAKACFVLKF